MEQSTCVRPAHQAPSLLFRLLVVLLADLDIYAMEQLS